MPLGTWPTGMRWSILPLRDVDTRDFVAFLSQTTKRRAPSGETGHLDGKEIARLRPAEPRAGRRARRRSADRLRKSASLQASAHLRLLHRDDAVDLRFSSVCSLPLGQ